LNCPALIVCWIFSIAPKASATTLSRSRCYRANEIK
jgi:hypothetical protein